MRRVSRNTDPLNVPNDDVVTPRMRRVSRNMSRRPGIARSYCHASHEACE